MPVSLIDPKEKAEGQAEETDQQRAVREQQEADGKRTEDQVKKENDLIDDLKERVEKFYVESNMTNVERGAFMERITREIGSIRTLAAAAKVRGQTVVEEPKKDGPGIQTRSLSDAMATSGSVNRPNAATAATTAPAAPPPKPAQPTPARS